jgi:hypothetical protein
MQWQPADAARSVEVLLMLRGILLFVQVLPKQFGGEADLIRVQDSKAALVAKQH